MAKTVKVGNSVGKIVGKKVFKHMERLRGKGSVTMYLVEFANGTRQYVERSDYKAVK